MVLKRKVEKKVQDVENGIQKAWMCKILLQNGENDSIIKKAYFFGGLYDG